MRLSLLESVFVWFVALGCAGAATSTLLLNVGMAGKRSTFALFVLVFAYKLVTRSLFAVMVTVAVAVLVTLFGLLMTANGEVSSGLTLGLVGAAVTGVLGNAVLRELDWWNPN